MSRPTSLALGTSAALAAGVAALALCYAPAFALATSLRAGPTVAIVAVVITSFGIACALIAAALWWTGATRRDFGLWWPSGARVAGWSLVALIAALAISATGVQDAEGRGSPLAGQSVEFLLLAIVLGASVQEETIFRGLLPGVFATMFHRLALPDRWRSPLALAIAAALFGAVHLPVGPYTAAVALFLGILAGAARRNAGLGAAIACHVMFNAVALARQVGGYGH